MRAEIVGVGTELLLGQIANTNAQWMSDRLAEIGVDVLYHQVVGDNLDRIVGVLKLDATVWPNSTAREITTPSTGE